MSNTTNKSRCSFEIIEIIDNSNDFYELDSFDEEESDEGEQFKVKNVLADGRVIFCMF